MDNATNSFTYSVIQHLQPRVPKNASTPMTNICAAFFNSLYPNVLAGHNNGNHLDILQLLTDGDLLYARLLPPDIVLTAKALLQRAND